MTTAITEVGGIFAVIALINTGSYNNLKPESCVTSVTSRNRLSKRSAQHALSLKIQVVQAQLTVHLCSGELMAHLLFTVG